MKRGKPAANWWSYSIEDRRREKILRDEAAGTAEVNPVIDGKRLLSYHDYLGLDRLLACQVPSSRVPDERIFIITHQLFELVFKQMIFDLGVIAETFRSLLEKDKRNFSVLAEAGGQEGSDPWLREFWLPARTAAARIKHGLRDVIPEVMMYLATDETFDNEEFEKGFRANLSPASGFQSAQFRLIQRALGKSLLLGVRLFPSDTYVKAYEGKTGEDLTRILFEYEDAGLVSVVDRLILQKDTPVATPPASSPLASAAELDDLAHEVLSRIAAENMMNPPREEEHNMPLLPDDEDSIKGMEIRFRERLSLAVEMVKERKNEPAVLTRDERALIEKRGRVFGGDWARAVREENERRKRHRTACRGVPFVLEKAKRRHLGAILNNLADADSALSEKFLLFHQNLVERRIGSISGTAGGGVPYLDFSRELIRWFPGLVALKACREKPVRGTEKEG